MLEPFEAPNLLEARGVRHGFFSRNGGTSRGLYAGLNCGFGSEDTRDAVTENRARVARHLCAGADQVVTVYQVHSSRAVRIEAAPRANEVPKADAMVTTTRGLVIGVLTADCAPVLFADASAGVIGAAHAGWRGAVGGVVEATVLEMEAAGATRGSIVAAVGPCIHMENYEVGDEFRDALVGKDGANARFFGVPAGRVKPHFDLTAFVVARLAGLGLRDVWAEAACTYRNESILFSYRRSQHRKEADYGRQISAIVLD